MSRTPTEGVRTERDSIMELPEHRSSQPAIPPGGNWLALMALVLTLGVVVTPLFRPVTAFDAGWNLRLGQWIWEHRGRGRCRASMTGLGCDKILPGVFVGERKSRSPIPEAAAGSGS